MKKLVYLLLLSLILGLNTVAESYNAIDTPCDMPVIEGEEVYQEEVPYNEATVDEAEPNQDDIDELLGIPIEEVSEGNKSSETNNASVDQANNSNTSETEEHNLRISISNASRYGNIERFFCYDFDGNGALEAFAFDLGATYDDGSVTGDIWFANTNETICLQKGNTYWDQFKVAGTAPHRIFCAEEYRTSSSKSHIWTVQSGKATYVNADVSGVFPGDEYTPLFCTVDAFDATADGAGHTWKDYYFFIDGAKLVEFGGITISESQLKQFENASTILSKYKAKGYKLKSIIYRSNHIININFLEGSTYDGFNYYVTVRYNDKDVQEIEQGDGVYQLSSGAGSSVSYPQRFISPSESGGDTSLIVGDGAKVELVKTHSGTVKVNFMRHDHSYNDGESAIDAFYDLPVLVNGGAAIELINRVFQSEYEEYVQALDHLISEEWYWGSSEDEPYYDYIDATKKVYIENLNKYIDAGVMYDNNGIISIMAGGEWMMGGVDDYLIYAHTFDLNSGKELTIQDLFPKTTRAYLESRIKRSIVSAMKGSDVDTELINELCLEDLLFFIDGDGTLCICAQRYQIGAGALGEPVINTGIQIYPNSSDGSQDDGDETDVQTQYNEIIQSVLDRFNDAFVLYADLTGDGVDELLIDYHPGYLGSGCILEIYTYKAGAIQCILKHEEYGLETITQYSKTKALMMYRCGHGGETYEYFKYKNGKLALVASKSRQAKAGGGDRNGPWYYYKGGSRSITKKAFTKRTKKLFKGKKKKWRIEDWTNV